jgi:tRNA (cmo5U34)-methyltransferase
MEQLKEAFNAGASQYDAQRKWIIPKFEDFYQNAIRAVEWKGSGPAILDIGAGTGLLSALLLERFPSASLTLIDVSDKMLQVARERFSGRAGIRYDTRDYRAGELGGPYDIICSALSIHHLDHNEKPLLYKNIYASLNPGGVFVNADQVEGETREQHLMYMKYWDDFVACAPIPHTIMKEAMARREVLDRAEKFSVQLVWLREAGFSDVDIFYKNRMFVIMRGRKQ